MSTSPLAIFSQMHVVPPEFCARSNELLHHGAPIGSFSSHWAAVAAMIRMSNPEFKSLGGDSESDLAEEARARDAIANVQLEGGK